MTYEAAFFVFGKPEPKGSGRALLIGGRARFIPANGRCKAWERAIRRAAVLHAPDEPIDAPIRVSLGFCVPAPKRPRWSVPAVKPDLDKLIRCVLDALTGVIYVDDARIVTITATSTYEEPSGVLIRVGEREG